MESAATQARIHIPKIRLLVVDGEVSVHMQTSLEFNPMDKGIPIFANGMSRLHAGVNRTNLEHSHTTLLTKIEESRLRGLLWSECGVRELLAGQWFEKTLAAPSLSG